MRIFGLIPAAGKSRRMGRSKLLLKVGDRSVLDHVVSAVKSAGVDELLVVVAPEAAAIAEVVTRAGAHVLRLESDTPDMRATCLRGLKWLEQTFQPMLDDAWLLLPADHPTVRPEIVRALVSAAEEHMNKSIVVPVHDRRRGHPTLLRWSHVAAIHALPVDQGLNAYIRAHADDTLEVPWPSDDILRDLDTPEDYQRLLDEASP